MHRNERRRRRVPDWLVGLILAIVLFVAGFLLLRAMGAGDDPGFDSGVSPQGLVLPAEG
jgi:hypothetical protein